MNTRFPTPSQIAECGGPCYTQGREACDCGLKDYEPSTKPLIMFQASQRNLQAQILKAFLPEALSTHCTYFELRMRPDSPIEITASFLAMKPAELTEITRNWQLTEIIEDEDDKWPHL